MLVARRQTSAGVPRCSLRLRYSRLDSVLDFVPRAGAFEVPELEPRFNLWTCATLPKQTSLARRPSLAGAPKLRSQTLAHTPEVGFKLSARHGPEEEARSDIRRKLEEARMFG